MIKAVEDSPPKEIHDDTYVKRFDDQSLRLQLSSLDKKITELVPNGASGIEYTNLLQIYSIDTIVDSLNKLLKAYDNGDESDAVQSKILQEVQDLQNAMVIAFSTLDQASKDTIQKEIEELFPDIPAKKLKSSKLLLLSTFALIPATILNGVVSNTVDLNYWAGFNKQFIFNFLPFFIHFSIYFSDIFSRTVLHQKKQQNQEKKQTKASEFGSFPVDLSERDFSDLAREDNKATLFKQALATSDVKKVFTSMTGIVSNTFFVNLQRNFSPDLQVIRSKEQASVSLGFSEVLRRAIEYPSYLKNHRSILQIELALLGSNVPSFENSIKAIFDPSLHNLNVKASRVILGNSSLEEIIAEYRDKKELFLLGEISEETFSAYLDIASENFSRKEKRHTDDKAKEISRRKFLQIFGVGGAAVGASLLGIEPISHVLSVTQSREKNEDYYTESVEESVAVNRLELFEKAFLDFISSYDKYGLDEIPIRERLWLLIYFKDQAMNYWQPSEHEDQQDIQNYLQSFFDGLLSTASTANLTVRKLLHYYHIGAANTRGENLITDIETSRKQEILSYAVAQTRALFGPTTNTVHLERLTDQTALKQAGFYNIVRTIQEITSGIHDIELLFQARAMLHLENRVHFDRKQMQVAEQLIRTTDAATAIAENIRDTVFQEFFHLVADADSFLNELFQDQQFIAELGLDGSVVTQFAIYTLFWKKTAEGVKVLSNSKEEITQEYINWISEDAQTAQEKLHTFLLDQGKLYQFWIHLRDSRAVKNNSQLSNKVSEIIQQFADLHKSLLSLVLARSEFNKEIGKKELDLDFQFPVGTEIARMTFEYVDTFMTDNSRFFAHLDERDHERMKIYLCLCIREIGPVQSLVLEQNLFPQDKILAFPYNWADTLNKWVTFFELILDYSNTRNSLLKTDFSFRDFSTLMSQFGHSAPFLRRLDSTEYYKRHISSNSLNRANEAVYGLLLS